MPLEEFDCTDYLNHKELYGKILSLIIRVGKLTLIKYFKPDKSRCQDIDQVVGLCVVIECKMSLRSTKSRVHVGLG